ncbi:hypothetical protein LEP1GSC021_1903 [Leptospira noguchii str. 1993005606]|nr:hypothetical protein LEP1GSC021_1903 [Leptospira noguchii str. 1993005606]
MHAVFTRGTIVPGAFIFRFENLFLSLSQNLHKILKETELKKADSFGHLFIKIFVLKSF